MTLTKIDQVEYLRVHTRAAQIDWVVGLGHIDDSAFWRSKVHKVKKYQNHFDLQQIQGLTNFSTCYNRIRERRWVSNNSDIVCHRERPVGLNIGACPYCSCGTNQARATTLVTEMDTDWVYTWARLGLVAKMFFYIFITSSRSSFLLLIGELWTWYCVFVLTPCSKYAK